MKFDLNSLTKRFLVNEGEGPSIVSWVQALSENVNSLKARSLSEERRIEVMKHQMREVRRASRRMTEQISHLEEQVNILQETKNAEE